MGMNAASFMANLFLYMHELEFMQQFLEAPEAEGGEEEAEELKQERWEKIFCRFFRYIKRYQDDRWSADSTMMLRSLYNSRWCMGGTR